MIFVCVCVEGSPRRVSSDAAQPPAGRNQREAAAHRRAYRVSQAETTSCARAVKMAEKLNSNFVLKYDQYSNYIRI